MSDDKLADIDADIEKARRQFNSATTPAKAKQIASKIEALQAERQRLDTFCERTGCTRRSYGFLWCAPCHDDFETYLGLMVSGTVVCGRCGAGNRPGVLVFTKQRCPRCQFDLSGDEYMIRLAEVANGVGGG